MALRASIALFGLFLSTPLYAQDAPICNEFAWSLVREQSLFKSGNLQVLASGASLLAIPETGFTVQLQPQDKTPFVMKPEREPRSNPAFAGVVSFSDVKPGAYQITLSDEAWIDVVQEGQRLRSTSHTGKKNCPGLRKSVRFQLQSGPLALQVSGNASDRINIAILPAQ